jgi:hypothetical protein
MARPSRAADRLADTSSSTLRCWPKRPAQSTYKERLPIGERIRAHASGKINSVLSPAMQQHYQGNRLLCIAPGDVELVDASSSRIPNGLHRRTSLLDGMRERLPPGLSGCPRRVKPCRLPGIWSASGKGVSDGTPGDAPG